MRDDADRLSAQPATAAISLTRLVLLAFLAGCRVVSQLGATPIKMPEPERAKAVDANVTVLPDQDPCGPRDGAEEAKPDDPVWIELNLRRLSRPDPMTPFCRAYALDRLRRFLDQPRVLGPWLAALRAMRGGDRSLFIDRFAEVSEAAPVWREWISPEEDAEVLVKILPVVQGPASEDLKARLSQLARVHWSFRVREVAAKACRRLGGRVEPAPRRPMPQLSSDGRTVLPHGGRAEVILDNPHLATPEVGACASSKRRAEIDFGGHRPGPSLEFAVADVCVLGFDAGEWGGSIEIQSGGQVVAAAPTWWRGPMAAVRVGSRLLVIEGDTHLSNRSGWITEIARSASGWHVDVIATLPGYPEAWGFDEAGDLVLRTTLEWHPEGNTDCVDAAGKETDCLVRFTRGGQLRAF